MRGPAAVRLAAGIGVSVVFLALTLARVDLEAVGEALRRVAPGGVLVAFGIVLVDLIIRAFRWKLLLRGVSGSGGSPGIVTAAAYLSIGYLANSLLPARLGDVARAYLAGSAFGVSRAATLGTILVERVADGATMLGLALLSSLLVASVLEVRNLAAYAVLLAGVAAVGLAVVWIALSRGRFATGRYPSLARGAASRVAAGMAAIRTPAGAIQVAAVTLAAAASAVAIGWVVAGAAGVPLSPLQAVLFGSGIALSLAIPAAPASLGTYEFVGVVILTGVGASPEQGLATILLMRLVSTLPLSVLGLAAVWILHVRPAAIFAPASAPDLVPDVD
jgi:glycosyltransferase 2 family protein